MSRALQEVILGKGKRKRQRRTPLPPRPLAYNEHAAFWWYEHRPILRFVMIFCVFISLFYLFTSFSAYYRFELFPAYLASSAGMAGYLLGLFYEGVVVTDNIINMSGFSITIMKGCDGIEPSALFASAVLAFPASPGKKMKGVLLGTALLLSINLVRIISLFLIRLYYPDHFSISHVSLWPGVYIFLSVLLWFLWIRWSMKGTRFE